MGVCLNRFGRHTKLFSKALSEKEFFSVSLSSDTSSALSVLEEGIVATIYALSCGFVGFGAFEAESFELFGASIYSRRIIFTPAHFGSLSLAVFP